MSHLKDFLSLHTPAVGTEDHDATPTADVPAGDVATVAMDYVPERDYELEDAMVEAEEAEETQDTIRDDVTHLVEGKVALERYQEILERGVDNGGVSRETAEVIALGMEQYGIAVGYTDGDESDVIPSLEAFGGSGSRAEATKKMMAAAVKKIKEFAVYIKNAIQAMLKSAKFLWAKVTVAGTALKERATKLAAQAAKLDASTLKNDSITIKGSKLFADGKYKGKEFNEMSKHVTLITASIPKGIAAYISNHAATLEAAAKDANDIDTVLTAWFNSGSNLALNGFTEAEADDKGRRYSVGPLMPDNQQVHIAYPVKTASDDKASKLSLRSRMPKTAEISIQSAASAKKAPDSHEIKVVTPSELASHAKRIAEMANEIMKAGNNQTTTENSINLLNKAVASLEKRAEAVANLPFGGEKNDKELSNIQYLIGSADTTLALQTEVPKGSAYLIRILNAMLAVVERQMKEYATPASA